MKFTKKNGGFTLVELIVVIAILAILAAIAVPAYSGYIQKANEAGDQTLLAAVNTAYAAACLENNVDMLSMKNAYVHVNDDGSIDPTKADPYAKEFELYFGDNKNSYFKVIKALYFDSEKGVFAELPAAYKGLLGGFKAEDTSAVKGSTFYTSETLGVSSLLGTVDMLADTVATGGYLESGTLSEIVYTDEYFDNLANTLGMDRADFDTKLDGMTEDERQNYLANSVVLSVAQTATGMETDALKTMLTGGNVQGDISKMLDDDPQAGLAQAALAYGMFTAYANSSEYGNKELQDKANNITSATDLTSILSDMNSAEFKAYMESSQGEDDLKGYLGAMGMISDSSSDSAAAESVLTNGFSDSALAGLLQSAIGSAG